MKRSAISALEVVVPDAPLRTAITFMFPGVLEAMVIVVPAPDPMSEVEVALIMASPAAVEVPTTKSPSSR